MYGLKFEGGLSANALTWSVSFNSDRSPVQGNFYSKDGKDDPDGNRGPLPMIDVVAWNSGFTGLSPEGADDNPAVTADGTATDTWIAVPDTHTQEVIPEASSILLGVLGLMSSGGYLRLRRRA